jgi:hypothetical protein
MPLLSPAESDAHRSTHGGGLRKVHAHGQPSNVAVPSTSPSFALLPWRSPVNFPPVRSLPAVAVPRSSFGIRHCGLVSSFGLRHASFFRSWPTFAIDTQREILYTIAIGAFPPTSLFHNSQILCALGASDQFAHRRRRGRTSPRASERCCVVSVTLRQLFDVIGWLGRRSKRQQGQGLSICSIHRMAEFLTLYPPYAFFLFWRANNSTPVCTPGLSRNPQPET